MAKPAAPSKKPASPRPPAGDEEDGAAMPGVADVEGRMKKRALNKLAKLVNDHPDEAVGALRRWLHDTD